MVNTRYRTELPEMMDDFGMKGAVLQESLDEISKINQLLGGNRLTLDGLHALLERASKSNEITIVDAGCGNGGMLRMLADYARKYNWKFKLVGIDANNFAISYAKELSKNYSNINFKCCNIMEASFLKMTCDVILCTLTLHHLSDDEIEELMRRFTNQAKFGVVVNDLQRSAWAYYLFWLISRVFGLNSMSRKDGLISILRGFKRRELEMLSERLKFKKYSIRWKWAFRYQWIISTI